MRYLSTRDANAAPHRHTFEEVLLAGLAGDGGLYVPETVPVLSAAEIASLSGLSYAELAARIIQPFLGEGFEPDIVRKITRDTYQGFTHAAVAPLKQLDSGLWLLELFHGPTLAFKDYPLQMVGRLFDHVLAQRKKRLTIVGATSGDTGSAAIEACRDRDALDVFILYPHGRPSAVQRRQMTTVQSANVHAIAIEGNFDDCQDMVKAMFADAGMREDLNLSAVNSINWARIMAQIVYYFAAGLALGAPHRPVAFSVPTGNFGNIFAAHMARRMGLPIERLVIGTNRNDILARFVETGEMIIGGVEASLSPSMDIQVSSNFERFFFELKSRDGAATAAALQAFRATGRLPVTETEWQAARHAFKSHRVDDTQTRASIARTWKESGELLDPHTAVSVAAARAERDGPDGDPAVPMVALACAHPAKFPDAVEEETGIRPALPPGLADLMERPERITVLPNDLATVKAFIRANARKVV